MYDWFEGNGDVRLVVANGWIFPNSEVTKRRFFFTNGAIPLSQISDINSQTYKKSLSVGVLHLIYQWCYAGQDNDSLW